MLPRTMAPAQQPPIADLHVQALMRHIHGEVAQALEMYGEILDREADNPDVLLNIGLIIYQSGDHATAISVWENALKSSSLGAQTARLLSKVFSMADLLENSLAAARRAVDLEPGCAITNSFLGSLYASAGLTYDAWKYHSRALELAPNDREIIKAVGAFGCNDRNNAGHAIQEVRRFLDSNPGDEEMDRLLGALYSAAGFYEDAIAHQEKRQSAGKDSIWDRLSLGINYQRGGQDDSARKTFNQLRDATETMANHLPDDEADTIRCRALLGRLDILLGDKRRARATFRQLPGCGAIEHYRYPDRMSLNDVPPRIERLQSIVRGRDIVVFAHGASLQIMEQRIEEFAGLDICYIGMNRFVPTEEYLLKKIGAELDVIAITPPQRINEMMPHILEFLRRSKKNMLLTSGYALEVSMPPNPSRDAVEQEFDEKLIYYDSGGQWPASPQDPLHVIASNTLSVVLPFAVIGKPRRIFLIGADGYIVPDSEGPSHFKKNTKEFVYCDSGDLEAKFDEILSRDTFEFNGTWETNVEAFAALYDTDVPPFFNVGPGSQIAITPKISLDECLELLHS